MMGHLVTFWCEMVFPALFSANTLLDNVVHLFFNVYPRLLEILLLLGFFLRPPISAWNVMSDCQLVVTRCMLIYKNWSFMLDIFSIYFTKVFTENYNLGKRRMGRWRVIRCIVLIVLFVGVTVSASAGFTLLGMPLFAQKKEEAAKVTQ